MFPLQSVDNSLAELFAPIADKLRLSVFRNSNTYMYTTISSVLRLSTSLSDTLYVCILYGVLYNVIYGTRVCG